MRQLRKVLARLPPLTGEPIEICYRSEAAHIHAGSFLRLRRISLDPALRREPGEQARILVHEIFHFVWLRLGNARRWSYASVLKAELASGTRGELGWSAEWRKDSLRPHDAAERTRAWRLYVCESFCDTGAWIYSGIAAHPEFTLPYRARRRRLDWFRRNGVTGRLPV
jgi:hypothetical protein